MREHLKGDQEGSAFDDPAQEHQLHYQLSSQAC